jgi:hypothetical protein
MAEFHDWALAGPGPEQDQVVGWRRKDLRTALRRERQRAHHRQVAAPARHAPAAIKADRRQTSLTGGAEPQA